MMSLASGWKVKYDVHVVADLQNVPVSLWVLDAMLRKIQVL